MANDDSEDMNYIGGNVLISSEGQLENNGKQGIPLLFTMGSLQSGPELRQIPLLSIFGHSATILLHFNPIHAGLFW